MISYKQTQASWYALRIRSKFEHRAATSLACKGYEVFLPVFSARHRWSDRIKEIEVPLFPGYLFCRLDVTDRIVPVLDTPGVVSIVGAGRFPIPIPDSEIDHLQAVIRSGLPAVPYPAMSAGARIVIDEGPLRGVEGVLLSVEDSGVRLIVSVELLQRSVSVEISRDWARLLPVTLEQSRSARSASA